MNAKMNVLIEKPLAMNLREVQELVATAKMNDVFLMEVSRYIIDYIYCYLITI